MFTRFTRLATKNTLLLSHSSKRRFAQVNSFTTNSNNGKFNAQPPSFQYIPQNPAQISSYKVKIES